MLYKPVIIMQHVASEGYQFGAFILGLGQLND
jgi:hypothetical protein